jgi:hypothetical protein
MLAALRTWIARRRFERATRAYDRQIAEAKAKHGRVNDARRAKTEALHRAMGLGA